MASVIRGASAPMLRHFRKETAALAVYWNYCARTNQDNVATASLDQLAQDTDFCVNSCAKARKYLVELQALEPVKDYVRPEWRNLPEEELKRILNLDRSEYFRPTGYIVVDGQRQYLLFNGIDDLSRDDRSQPQTSPDLLSDVAQNDRSSAERKTLDLSPHATSTGDQVGSRHTTPPSEEVISERETEGKTPVVASLDSAGASGRADSLQESKDSKTLLESKESKDQKEKEKDQKIKDSREAWMKGLSLLLNIREDAYAQAQKYINFFQGKSPKEKGGKWDQFKIDNSEIQVNAVVVYAFAYWWTRTYKGMTIRKLETIREYFDLFTALKNYDDHITHAEKDLKALLGLNEVVKREIVTDPEAYAELERLRELAAKMAHEGANPWQTLQKQMAG